MDSLSNHPKLEMLRRDSLKQNARNPNKHSEKKYTQMTSSIRRLGFWGVLIIDDQNRVLAGNALWVVAGRLGMEEVPCIRAKFLSEADRRAFILAHNQFSKLGEFDDELLQEELEFLLGQGFDLGLAGFEMADLSFSLEGATKEDPVELPRSGDKAISRSGDHWRIGRHGIICGNASDPASYEAVLRGESAAMAFGDAPYNVPIDGHVSGLGKIKHREFAEASGEMSPAEFTAFLRSAFRNCARFSKDGSIHFHCMDWRHMREILDAAEGVYSLKQLAIWVKPSGGMGTFYRSRHELIFIFKAGRAPHINNFRLGETGRYRTNVWEYEGGAGFRKGRAADLTDHPTVKPQAMVADAILDCSKPGDLILDPFCGSGTSLAAAHRTGRRGAGIEIEPLYVDVALRRLMKATGLTAVLADGRSFDEVASDRNGGEVDHG